MAELDKATGDSQGGKAGLTKRKIALPMLLVIGLAAGVLIYFIAKRQSGASGAASAAQTGLPYAVPSAQTPANDGNITGLMALVGNLGQQMDTNFAALQKTSVPTPAAVPTPDQVQIGGNWASGLVALFGTPGTSQPGINVAKGTKFDSAGPPTLGEKYWTTNPPAGEYAGASSLWQPVNYQGTTLYAWQPDVNVLSSSGPTAHA